jgi:hypothetical protein
MKFTNQLSIFGSAALMLALMFVCCFGCGKTSSSETRATQTTPPAAPSASTQATNQPTVKQDSNSTTNSHPINGTVKEATKPESAEAASQHVVRAVESPDTQVAYDLSGGGITCGPPGGMKILNPEWPTGKPGESIAGSFGVNQQGELVMSVGFPPRVISQ